MGAGSTDGPSWNRDGQSLVLAGEPRLAYQPVIDLASGRVLGFEALLRWEHPTEGAILPQLLIPWAEANGDIVTLGRWVLVEGCRQAAGWPSSMQLAVNCSIVQLRRGVAADAVRTALEQSGLTPDRLTVEVTEHAVSEAPAAAELRAIIDLGVQLAVDDVGTSWSSFELLRQLAVNTIKIDESFVSGLEASEGINRMVVETVVHLAHSCGMSTVAEGVETANHAAIVREFDSDAAQGYFFSPPLEAESATVLANMSDLTFPLEGTGWVDDDEWPFPGVQAERMGVGNSLRHARHARVEDLEHPAVAIDLSELVLPGLPLPAPGGGDGEGAQGAGEDGVDHGAGAAGVGAGASPDPGAATGTDTDTDMDPDTAADPDGPPSTTVPVTAANGTGAGGGTGNGNGDGGRSRSRPGRRRKRGSSA